MAASRNDPGLGRHDGGASRRRVRRPRWFTGCAVLAAVALLVAGCVAPPGPGEGDMDVQGHVDVWSVLPPGNGYPTGVTAANRDDQRLLYERLDVAVARGELSDEEMGRFFKDARIDLPAGEEVASQHPRPGVQIRWDRWGVPYVEGSNATNVAFGAGFAMMEARAMVAELSRVVGRRGGQELGVNDVFAAIDPERRVDWSDEELEARLDEMIAADPAAGAAVLAELDAYLDGINDWIAQHPEHRLITALLGVERHLWARSDLVASLLTVVTGAASGGGELENARALAALGARLGDELAATTYADLRAADAPTTTHVEESTAYPVFDDGSGPDAPIDPRSVATPDLPEALSAASGPTAADPSVPTVRDPKPGRSNVIAVAGSHSRSGRPLLVGGPQNGLTSPALLFEMSLVGGGYRARGVVAPGTGPYVFVGRSDDYAWTSTSGETDQTDVRAELLCEADGSTPTADSDRYVFRDVCRPFHRPPGATRRTAERSVHGPVLSRGMVGGRPVAFSTQRASSGAEMVAALGLRRMNRGEIGGPDDFLDAARTVAHSGHWFYVDDEHVAYTLVGRHPVRRSGASTDLPTWGTGEWEWQGWIEPESLPHSVDPAEGCLHSWNNRVAPGWHAADDDWGNVGPHRVDLLVDRVCGRTDLTLADVVAAHTEAGAADLRGAKVLPAVLQVLDGSDAPSPWLEQVRAQLAGWALDGAPRLDVDRDLRFDHPAVGVMDELFDPLVREVFGQRLGGLIDQMPLRVDAGPRTTSSSFGYGWHGVVERDLRRVLGDDRGDAVAPVACGDGDLEQCRERLWAAIERAGRTVRDRQLPWDRDHPERWWTPTILRGRIPVLPIVFNPVAMVWSNRPAYQLAVEFR